MVALNRETIELVARGSQFLLGVIAMACVTVATGPSYGDFALLATFSAWIYALIVILAVMRFQSLVISPMVKLGIDAILTICLLAAGIAVASSNYLTLCNNDVYTTDGFSTYRIGGTKCGSLKASIAFIFFTFAAYAVTLFFLCYDMFYTKSTSSAPDAVLVVEDNEASSPVAEYNPPEDKEDLPSTQV